MRLSSFGVLMLDNGMDRGQALKTKEKTGENHQAPTRKTAATAKES
jgi:hypothetical protein